MRVITTLGIRSRYKFFKGWYPEEALFFQYKSQIYSSRRCKTKLLKPQEFSFLSLSLSLSFLILSYSSLKRWVVRNIENNISCSNGKGLRMLNDDVRIGYIFKRETVLYLSLHEVTWILEKTHEISRFKRSYEWCRSERCMYLSFSLSLFLNVKRINDIKRRYFKNLYFSFLWMKLYRELWNLYRICNKYFQSSIYITYFHDILI